MPGLVRDRGLGLGSRLSLWKGVSGAGRKTLVLWVDRSFWWRILAGESETNLAYRAWKTLVGREDPNRCSSSTSYTSFRWNSFFNHIEWSHGNSR